MLRLIVFGVLLASGCVTARGNCPVGTTAVWCQGSYICATTGEDISRTCAPLPGR
jgi:hypothetical protein